MYDEIIKDNKFINTMPTVSDVSRKFPRKNRIISFYLH